MDHLLGFDPLPWLDRLRRARTALAEAVREHRSALHRDRGPTRALDEYAHVYVNPAGGTVRIIADDSGLRWQGWSSGGGAAA
jgi:hypothetical protein